MIEPLAETHRRSNFTCGNGRIDDHFRETVSQDVKRKYATCFVARELATNQVAGFYTLSSSNVPLNDVPEALAKKLPRYPTVPAVLIGWLGRHHGYAGLGLGEALLFDAIVSIDPCEEIPIQPAIVFHGAGSIAERHNPYIGKQVHFIKARYHHHL